MTKYFDVRCSPPCKECGESGSVNVHTLRDEITPIYLTFQFHQRARYFIATLIRNTGEAIYGFYFLKKAQPWRNTLKFTAEKFCFLLQWTQ